MCTTCAAANAQSTHLSMCTTAGTALLSSNTHSCLLLSVYHSKYPQQVRRYANKHMHRAAHLCMRTTTGTVLLSSNTHSCLLLSVYQSELPQQVWQDADECIQRSGQAVKGREG